MKKLNQKGFTHHLIMLVILALVLGAMGFAGYRVWQNRNIDAKAYSFTMIDSGAAAPYARVDACSVKTPSGRYYTKIKFKNLRSTVVTQLSVFINTIGVTSFNGNVAPGAVSNVFTSRLGTATAPTSVNGVRLDRCW